LLVPSGIISAAGNILGLNVNTGIVSATGNIRGGNLNTTGLISTSGNVQAGNLLTTGLISSTGNINVANIAAGNITTAIMSATGNITGPNIIATVVQVSSLLSVTGNIQGGNLLTDGLISTTGNITGNYFIGNGSQLTGINLTRIGNGTSQVSIPVASSNVNITIGATPNVAVFDTTGAYITGLTSVTGNVVSNNVVATTIVNAASHTGGLVSVTGNITGGNVLTGGLTSSTGNITGGNVLTGGLISATGNITGGNVAATNYTGLVTHSIRNAGNVTGTTLTLNVTTDNIVKSTFNDAFTVAFSNIVAGRVITLIATNTSAGDTDIITAGISSVNMQGDSTLTVSPQTTAVITYYSLDGDTANIYASAVYN
jgi:hypothetical protein